MTIDIIVTSNNNEEFGPQLLVDTIGSDQINISKLCYEKKSTDGDKVKNIKEALTSDSDVILAMRGGSGITRIIKDLPKNKITKKHKIFVGYSDLTAVLNYFNHTQDITCIHGPMAFELTTEKRITKFINCLSKQDVIFEIAAKWLVPGELQGQVVGGNLMLVSNAIGTFYQVDTNDKILLIEEIDEPIDKIDRMFAQLRDSKILDGLRGIVLGNFKDCASNELLLELFEYYFKDLNIPVLYDVNLGHIDDSDYIYLNTDLKIDQSGIYYNEES